MRSKAAVQGGRALTRIIQLAVLLVGTSSATALSPGTDLLVPAAARVGPWVTDLYLLNLANQPTTVQLRWLIRGQANPDPQTVTVQLAGNQSRTLHNVVESGFGLPRGEGALRVTASRPVVASCRIFAELQSGTYGQGFEAVPSTHATAAGDATHVVGLASTAGFRSNVYALAGSEGASISLQLRDPSGLQIAATTVELAVYEPLLEPFDRLFGVSDIAEATLFARVDAGSAVLGASRVDNQTSDPITLTAWFDGDRLGTGHHFGSILGSVPSAVGGLALTVDDRARVIGLELSFPAERCPALFAAGEDLSDNPLTLDQLATGHSFASDYPGGGAMAWVLRLQPRPPGPSLEGTLTATGSGWSDELAACNGDHSPATVVVGRRQTTEP